MMELLTGKRFQLKWKNKIPIRIKNSIFLMNSQVNSSVSNLSQIIWTVISRRFGGCMTQNGGLRQIDSILSLHLPHSYMYVIKLETTNDINEERWFCSVCCSETFSWFYRSRELWENKSFSVLHSYISFMFIRPKN